MDSYLEKLRQELEETISAASVERMATGPSGSWTAAQVLEHLYLTYHHTNHGIARCLEKGVPLGRPITFMDRVRTFAVVNVGYFPNGRKSPERAVPKGMACEEVRGAIVPEIQKMDTGFEECVRKFGPRARILDHPVLGPLTAEQWRRFHLAHGKHHARQIRERSGGA
jgi:hypothetical protein